MTPEEMEERDILEFSDDEGNTILLQVNGYFFYNGEEYASLKDAQDGSDTGSYVMKVNTFTDENGEEMEEFVVPDENLLETLLEIADTQLFTEED